MAQAMNTAQRRCAGGITYTLTRRRVRNINLRVRADGSVAASAAPRVPAGAVDAFVASHAGWVAAAQARAAVRQAAEDAAPLPDPRRGQGPDHRAVRNLFPAVCGALPGRADAPHCGAGYENPLGVLQFAYRHAGVQPAAVHNAPCRAGICGCA